MVFEQYYKNVFKSDFEAILGGKYELLVSNDINYNSFKKGCILAVIETSQGVPSHIENVTATNYPTIITFKCETNEMQNVLSLINDFVNQQEGIYNQINNSDITFTAGYNTPYVITTKIAENINNETIYTCIIQLVGNVFFTNMYIPQEKAFYIIDEWYKLDGIQSCVTNKTITYSASDTNNKYPIQNYMGETITIDLVLWESYNNKNIIGALSSNTIYQFKNGIDEYFVKVVRVVENEINGVMNINLSLVVVNGSE